jgi:hypothetical protein
MGKILIVIILIASVYGCIPDTGISLPQAFSETIKASEQVLENAFKNRISNIQVEGEGVVIKILPDDLDGSKHQRFIVQLASGKTLLIAHNIDLAPKIISLQKGDEIAFFGEYEWNAQGGIIHWTHRDPGGHHVGGWIDHNGKRYE